MRRIGTAKKPPTIIAQIARTTRTPKNTVFTSGSLGFSTSELDCPRRTEFDATLHNFFHRREAVVDLLFHLFTLRGAAYPNTKAPVFQEKVEAQSVHWGIRRNQVTVERVYSVPGAGDEHERSPYLKTTLDYARPQNSDERHPGGNRHLEGVRTLNILHVRCDGKYVIDSNVMLLKPALPNERLLCFREVDATVEEIISFSTDDTGSLIAMFDRDAHRYLETARRILSTRLSAW